MKTKLLKTYPIRFEPLIKQYVWGTESWEISDREEGRSVVANGEYKSLTLNDLIQESAHILGQKISRFPLLCKIIDAQENLSVQVHPNEKTAPSLHGEAKTECWYILQDGSIYAGLKSGANEKTLLDQIALNQAESLLHKLAVKKGDAVYIPGGRVHAICGGMKLFEVQQNSNTTYRLYDWGRTGRALHLKEAMATILWDDRGTPIMKKEVISRDAHHAISKLVACPFFILEQVDVQDRVSLPNSLSFQIFFCVSGSGEIVVDGHTEPLLPETTFLIPAASKTIMVQGACSLLRTRLP